MKSLCYVLMPGMHGTRSLFTPFAEALHSHRAEEIHLQYIDYPTDRAQSYQDLLLWLDQEIDNTQPKVLIAESFSGPLAIQLAKRKPQNILGVVLVASFCHTPRPSIYTLFPIRALLTIRPPYSVLRYFLTGQDASPQELSALQELISAFNPKHLSERIRSVLSLEENDMPSLPSTPVLILNAEDDNLIPWSAQTHLETHFPHSEVHWIKAPHFVLQKQPLQCAEIIVSWVQNQCSNNSKTNTL